MASHYIFRTISANELDCPCTNDEFLATLASRIEKWELIAPFLEIDEVKCHEIREDLKGDYQNQKLTLLRVWRQKFGSKATYCRLAQALQRFELSTPEQSFINNCVKHLKQSYLYKQPPFATVWPEAERNVYINPTFQTAGQSRAIHCPKEINVSSIFQLPVTSSKPKFILLEGPAGSGKSTFVWYAGKKWAEGEFFPSLELLVLIDLANLNVRQASCLADLIPHPDKKIRDAVASWVVRTRGERFGILANGLDQVPHAERDGLYITRVLKGSPAVALPNSSILVTSRPEGADQLLPYFSFHIRIMPFSPEQINAFFYQAAEDHPSGDVVKQKLRDIQERQPAIIEFCKLPLHAAILVYFICRIGDSLLSANIVTMTDFVTHFIRNFIRRHIEDYYPTMHKPHFLKGLPRDPEVACHFQFLCKLAYHSIKEEVIVVDEDYIESIAEDGVDPDPAEFCSLSLMRSEPYPTLDGGVGYRYSYLHQTVQEYLAAFHASKLTEAEQNAVAEELLKSSPPTMVFLSGLLKERSKPILSVLCEQLIRSLGDENVEVTLSNEVDDVTSYPVLLQHLLTMSFEAQSQPLGQYVAERICINGKIIITLPPAVVLSRPEWIPCFISCALQCPKASEIYLNLNDATLNDPAVATLFKSVQRRLPDSLTTSCEPQKKLVVLLSESQFTHNGTESFCQDLHCLPPNTLTFLDLSDKWHLDSAHITGALLALCLAAFTCHALVEIHLNDLSSNSQSHTWYLYYC